MHVIPEGHSFSGPESMASTDYSTVYYGDSRSVAVRISDVVFPKKQ